MDYKQKYEEALERAKKVHTTNVDENKKSTEYIFPELRESENEKIRKGIIKYLEQSQFGEEHYCIDDDIVRYYIDWLEKQGEQSFDDKVNEAMREVEEKAKAFTAKHKGETTEGILAQMRGEETPADRIESRFKIGDWINNDGAIWRIEGVSGKEYILGGRPDVVIQNPIHIIDSEFHPWTIQDAKDGDVLAFKDGTSGVLLYKENTENFGVLSYCRIIRNSFIDKEESGWGSTLLSPATKEQQDLLFQKMKEAGYEWNADKKELKKIEHNAIEWNEEDERILNATIKTILISRGSCEEDDEVKDRFDDELRWLESIKQRIKGK